MLGIEVNPLSPAKNVKNLGRNQNHSGKPSWRKVC